ncbi:MAG: threonine--tRNA ligase [Gammaproteobacteria bacterium 39-13]|nr:threonine--tRNA ligase [Gammaproteobacteria bacterium]OJV94367.1 MAG: threonine--tRNA ligase [Gammaproteobacteria bacterium 39-13]
MPIVTLPDGSQKSFEQAVTVYQVAESIGKGLANAALAGKVNGKPVDTSYLIEEDSQLVIVTEKDKDGLEVLRHSCAHLLAHAIKSIYPQAQVTIGPVIEDGFYYDIAFGRPFTPEDLALFEEKMAEIAKADLPVSRHLISRDDAIAKFKAMGEHYKVQIIQDIPASENLTFYQEGDFIDLCRGPHVPSTGKIKAFKLLKVAGAYWRGDQKNEMLQRVYGTAWANKKDLDAYLYRLEEAEKRDHRKLAKKYDLFHMQEEAPGMVFWHPKGWVIYQQIEQYVRNLISQHGYQEVRTPQVVDKSLWERSGHWEMFHANMFTVESDERIFAVKPMNCPCHVQIYNQGIKSYRDLPIRLAEFGSCHRNEPSGALHGIMRTRNFVQDDAHIFCTEDQIQSEVAEFIDLLFKVYSDFGFKDVLIKLSTRPEHRVGSDEIWDKAEKSLEDALNAKGLAWELHPGEGAFYGPKIEFSLRDCMGRVWQCGTVQVDFSMPVRLGAEYVAEDGSRQIPVMVHRAILGSLERFIGILIEEHAGNFPTWLAPIQVAVLNITQNQAAYAEKVAEELKTKGIRALTDLRNEKIGFKIREHTVQRVPYLVVIGDREVEQQTVTIRTREGKDLGSMTLNEFEDKLISECKTKAVNS